MSNNKPENMSERTPLVIIGSGLAGYIFAKAWRRADPYTPLTIVTKDDGAFYSKPMLSVAMLQNKTPDELVIADAATMADELSATILTQTNVTAINRKQHTIQYDNGQTLSYKKLVLACGAKPYQIEIAGDTQQAMCSVNNLGDYRQFRIWLSGKKHIAILGSGLAGTEFAHELSKAGFQVSVVSLDPHPLSRFIPAKSGQLLQQQLHSLCGIDWRMNVTLKGIEAQKAGDFQLLLSDQSNLRVDGVLSAVGLRANTRLAEQAGLKTNKGVIVDKGLMSSDPDIYALGDCAEVDGDWCCFIAPIHYCSEVLAKNLVAGNNLERLHYPAMVIMLKTATYPLSFCIPSLSQEQEEGEWQITQQSGNQRAEYRDINHKLRGFVVTGTYAKEHMTLLNEITSS